MNRERLIRQLRKAMERGDRAAVLMLNARLVYSVPFRPEPDYPIFTALRQVERVAA